MAGMLWRPGTIAFTGQPVFSPVRFTGVFVAAQPGCGIQGPSDGRHSFRTGKQAFNTHGRKTPRMHGLRRSCYGRMANRQGKAG